MKNDGGKLVACVSCGAAVSESGAREEQWGTCVNDEKTAREPCCSRECALRIYSEGHVARYFSPADESPERLALRDMLAFVVLTGQLRRNPYSFPAVGDAFEALGLDRYGNPKPVYSEKAIYEAQNREDARASREGRKPRLITRMEDITDGGKP